MVGADRSRGLDERSGNPLERGPRFGAVVVRGGERAWRHPFVWWALVAHLAFALLFSVLLPFFRGPDEAQHVDRLRQQREGTAMSDPTEVAPHTPGVLAADHIVRGRGRALPHRRADAPARPQRRSFAELDATFEADKDNHLSQHPPLYYVTVSLVPRAVAAVTGHDLSWDREVWLLRLVSVMLTAPVPIAAALAAEAAGGGRGSVAAAAAFPLLVPMATAMGATVNNDAAVVVLSAATVALGARFLAWGRTSDALGTAGAAAAAALTKATAATVAPWAALVLALGVWRHRRATSVSRRLLQGGGSMLLLAAGASWYVLNLVRHSDPQPSPVSHGASESSGQPFWPFVGEWLDHTSRTFWGQPGRRAGVELDWAVSHSLTALTVALALVAVLWARPRLPVLMLAVMAAWQVAMMFVTNWDAHLNSGGLLVAIQGRYLFTALVPAAVLVALGARVLLRGEHRLLAAAGAAAAAGVALHVVIARLMLSQWWEGPAAGWSERVRSLLAWSPAPPVVTWGLLVAPVVVALVGAVLGARWFSRARPRPLAAGSS